jgi:hypothetical protein
VCNQAGGGIIIQAGFTTAIGSDTTNTQTVFPWTTGMVTALVTDGLPTSTGSETHTGSDTRTPLGAGNLTLVAGGLLQQTSTTLNSSAEHAIVSMTFRPQNLPSMTPPGLAALGALLVLGAGYAFRRRLH